MTDQLHDVPLHMQAPVRILNGLLAGCAAPEDDAVSTFKNIPFAARPVGARRWRPPVPVSDWGGLRDATEGRRVGRESGRASGGVGGRQLE